ncbi:PAS domain-containing protein [Salinicoccus bachuensis]|uniref:PAS domain-containing protein n=1 Tax=Salinicoccus bachuensis TaxID=3136731 RepID=A0ABZ3CLB4_9STAP
MSMATTDVSKVRSLLLRMNRGEPVESVMADFSAALEEMEPGEMLGAIMEVKYVEKEVSIYDVREFLDIHEHIHRKSLTDIHVSKDGSHPLRILKKENRLLSGSLEIIGHLLECYEAGERTMVDTLIAEVIRFEDINCHFNRKEKLYFPLLERRGIYTLPRKMWAQHDTIRLLLRALRKRTEKIDDIKFRHVRRSFDDLKDACEEMMLEETYLLIPLTQSLFKERDWTAIAAESRAFGYAIDSVGKYQNGSGYDRRNQSESLDDTVHMQFGGGYLTAKEANLILNHLPVEITFVDRNGLFKYFNDIVESGEMMFIRTPLSIGRNVANCHPPKSTKKVMHIIHDLKKRKKESETMWFRKKDKYVHVTYKAVFDESGDFMGILEYVQDIQPFFELPREVKRGPSPKRR